MIIHRGLWGTLLATWVSESLLGLYMFSAKLLMAYDFPECTVRHYNQAALANDGFARWRSARREHNTLSEHDLHWPRPSHVSGSRCPVQ